ncbi:toxin-antitoxin system HicB family antitoxin [Vandammella animalimorsus]|uniref:Toxin-antitoxin system HicB family antitoxin n=1 Tax=Vandammella animalimorsus TaxID=2029117 RepID=A0A2A2T3Y1_9BURK|nr:toxin-antitoxin system HicB family antitoxin [Vandammella animalimorsus]PAT31661.1 toxin-antitoxin system HicB family antitoxin [Vandammella animalimorsus]PAX16219.1 toxin-antitoxin system HicB family antitoxin [Vandammella animalimorsus]PAX18248.1 toxin-antitoxin system HicB family antitoxin [Vandammella animalimorsus]
MSALNVHLPESLHAMARQLAAEEGILVGHLIALALAEKISALKTEDYLQSRSRRACEDQYQAVLDAVRAQGNRPLPDDAL